MARRQSVIPESTKRLPTGGVAQKFNVTPRSVDRWWKNPNLNFPQPIFINGRKYWSVGDLDKWQREQAGRVA